jgi:ParB family chromosome partitioning protein
MKRAALGKGISALIPDGPQLHPTGQLELAVGEIRANPLQPRRRFTENSLDELARSIKAHGVIQPVVVTRSPAGGFHLIAGERRWRAAQLAGLSRIPAVVRESVETGDELALALIENLQREDLTPIEEARAYHHLRKELGHSQEEIAHRVGKDRSTVANALRLLSLPIEIQEQVDNGALSAGHARALAGLSSPEQQHALAVRCCKEGWSVRELERHLSPVKVHKSTRPLDPDTAAAAERLAGILGTQVKIHRGRRGGEIRLRFASEQELIRLYRFLARETQ